MFDYSIETVREYILEDPNTGTYDEIKSRLAFIQDKVKNMKKIKEVGPTFIFGSLEARDDLTRNGIMLCIIADGKEYFVKINSEQKMINLLKKVCERLNKVPENHYLVYDNSTMNNDSVIHDILIKLKSYQNISNVGTFYLFEK